MLFVQEIDLWYRKDVRYPEYANVRNSLKFVPVETDIIKPDCEVLYHYSKLEQSTDGINKWHEYYMRFGAKIFGEEIYTCGTGHTLRSVPVHILSDGENYKIMFYDEVYKTVFTLSTELYGRIQYNERFVTEYAWYYRMHTMNFISCDRNKFREKMFFRKVPDYEYKNMQYLKYC